MKHFKYTIISIVIIAVLFGVKYWNDRTLDNSNHQNTSSVQTVAGPQEICGTLQKAFNESSYTAWDFKNCAVSEGNILTLEVTDSSIPETAETKMFDDQSTDVRQADSLCDLFYKSYPSLMKVTFRVFDKDARKAVLVYETTNKICNKAAADYVLKAEAAENNSGKIQVENESGTVVSSALNIESVDVETVETTASDIQQKAEELRSEVENVQN